MHIKIYRNYCNSSRPFRLKVQTGFIKKLVDFSRFHCTVDFIPDPPWFSCGSVPQTDHFLSIRWQFKVKGNNTGHLTKTCTCVFMTSTQKKTWIGDLTALVTLSNILIKQVEAKKSMFKKNWFQANGYEQEKAFLIRRLDSIVQNWSTQDAVKKTMTLLLMMMI